mmetsp:Transcript_61166/g.68492  ORF Transcript_61166/g.68492 Transcript_61166/m.68492 type:complete len:210 (+) Transcript_61166:128-757(+)|eukprot:CAMPEP_0170765952 /NCGR_PEP_ID=MMETSP0733-20121128/4894_1 /TAXON_ID=186038 /ORGANISM="Fragilariopsis kerguelensis, Strain L26-C5" /LENGTH=209 /DNA_ID=CAMNT_0011106867 /DNA_START=120 /DNA_END=749 /DNA_ORIENTATION=-
MSSSSSSSLPLSRIDIDVDVDPYKSSSFIGHSLWMIPCGDSKIVYSKLISEISSDLGTVDFLPHITLVAAMMKGEEDTVQRAKALAAELAPFTFEFDDISYRDAYFQCVYTRLKRTEAVVLANDIARNFFPERQSDPEYMPHLSLVYGDFDEETKRNQIVPKLKKADHDSQLTLLPVDSFEVWSTQGDVKEWYKVETIPLTGKVKNQRD